VAALYERANAGRTMTAVRDRKVWEWMLGCGVHSWLFSNPRVIVDRRGRLCGYLTLTHKEGVGMRELGVGPDEPSWRAVLGALVARAKRCKAETIALPLPWDHPMTVFLRQATGVKLTLATRRGGGPLLKIVDFPGLMRALQPLFAERWRTAGSALPDARFTLASEIGAAGVTVAGGGVQTGEPGRGAQAWIPRRWLSGLVSGTYSVRDIAGQKGSRIPGKVARALDILFPAGWPLSHRSDTY
jgi:hypothetical protein